LRLHKLLLQTDADIDRARATPGRDAPVAAEIPDARRYKSDLTNHVST
jgi:hypothetical protein